jgi:hypothetical protein
MNSRQLSENSVRHDSGHKLENFYDPTSAGAVMAVPRNHGNASLNQNFREHTPPGVSLVNRSDVMANETPLQSHLSIGCSARFESRMYWLTINRCYIYEYVRKAAYFIYVQRYNDRACHSHLLPGYHVMRRETGMILRYHWFHMKHWLQYKSNSWNCIWRIAAPKQEEFELFGPLPNKIPCCWPRIRRLLLQLLICHSVKNAATDPCGKTCQNVNVRWLSRIRDSLSQRPVQETHPQMRTWLAWWSSQKNRKFQSCKAWLAKYQVFQFTSECDFMSSRHEAWIWCNDEMSSCDAATIQKTFWWSNSQDLSRFQPIISHRSQYRQILLEWCCCLWYPDNDLSRIDSSWRSSNGQHCDNTSRK